SRENFVTAQPIAAFSASTISGGAPLTVAFSDLSLGNPAWWNWSFGDNTWFNTTDSSLRNASHEYATVGHYTVVLEVGNEYGTSQQRMVSLITVTGETRQTACTNVTGLTIVDNGNLQESLLDTSLITNYTFDPGANRTLEFAPSEESGLRSIRLISEDGTGFQETPEGLITGNITGVLLEGVPVIAQGFSDTTGSNCSVSYRLNLSRYPVETCISTTLWEGDTPQDHQKFLRLAYLANFASMADPAYTIRFTANPALTQVLSANLTLSVNSTWVDTRAGGRGNIGIIRLQEDDTGEALQGTFLFRDESENLDYFETTSPRGLSTFALTGLTGSGNFFQLIPLSVAAHVVSGGSDRGDYPSPTTSTTKPTTVPTTVPTSVPILETLPADITTQVAPLETNENGTVLKKIQITYLDEFLLVIPEGTVATNRSGYPPDMVTIRYLSTDGMEPILGDHASGFTGYAYELLPEDAVFTPPVSLSFFIPEEEWSPGSPYIIRAFDRSLNIWEDIPTIFNAADRSVSAEVTHFSVWALFKGINQTYTPEHTPPATFPPSVQEPVTILSIFSKFILNIGTLIIENTLISLLLLAICVIIGYVVWRRRH
ncbi:MAG: PKD domain-containing protein, partial [Methanomicrobiales archaeon]|nr:PKD domain-containing protein [Methanomicrobiales archaeon]